MNEQVIDDLYARALQSGYKKGRADFVQLIQSNDDVFNDMYQYVQSKGYAKDAQSFSSLVGRRTAPTVKKKVTASVSEPGSLVSPEPEVPVAEPVVEEEVQDLTVAEPDFFEERMAMVSPQLIDRGDEDEVAQELTDVFKPYGFEVEPTSIGDALKVTAANGETIEVDLDPMELPSFLSVGRFGFTGDMDTETEKSEAKKLQDFLRKNRQEGLDAPRRFVTQEQIDNNVKKINDAEEAINNQFLSYVERKSIFDAEFTEAFPVNDVQAVAADPEGYNDFVQRGRDLDIEAQGLRQNDELLKEQGRELDKAAGEYTSMLANRGDWGGGLWNKMLTGIGRISEEAYNVAMDKVTGAIPLMTTDPAYYQSRFTEEAERRGITPPYGTDGAKATRAEFLSFMTSIDSDVRNEIGDKVVDDYKKERKFGEPIDVEKAVNRYSQYAASENMKLKGGELEAVRNGLLNVLGDSETTPEWTQLKEQGFWGGAFLGLAESIPAMVVPGGWAARTAAMYGQVASHLGQEMASIPEFQDVSEKEKAMFKLPLGIAVGALESMGFRNVVNQKGLLNSILMRALNKSPKNVTGKAFNDIVDREVNSMISRGLLKVGAGGLAEFETGLAQEIADITGKEIYNALKEKEMFDTPESFGEGLEQVVIGGLQEAVGGLVLGVPNAVATSSVKKDFTDMDDATFELFQNVSKQTDSGQLTYRHMFYTNLKSKINQGKISKKEAQQQMDNLDEVIAVNRDIPSDLTIDQQKRTLGILLRKKDLQEQIEGKDPILVKRQQEELNSLNRELDQILYGTPETDAIQEPSPETVDAPEPTRGSEEVGEGVPDIGEPTAEVEAEDQVAEAAPTAKVAVEEGAEVELEVTTTDKKGRTLKFFKTTTEKDGVKTTRFTFNRSDKSPEQRNTSKATPVEEALGGLYEFEVPEGLQENGAVPVAVTEVRESESGASASVIFEQDGQRFEDEVVLTPKTQEVAVEETVSEPTQGVTEEEQVDIDDFFSDKEIEGVDKVADNLVVNRKQLSEDKAETAQDERKISRIKQIAKKAAVSLKKEFPDVRIVLHETEGQYKRFAGKRARGAYVKDDKSKTIHINLSIADLSTVPHEVFHALLLEAAATDPQALVIARNMLESVRKVVDPNSEMSKAIEKFVAKYEDVPVIQDEEYLAELMGILSSQYRTLDKPSKNTVKEFLRKLAKLVGIDTKFGLDEFFGPEFLERDEQVIDLLNTISGKVSKGQFIEAADVKTMGNILAEATPAEQAQAQREVRDFKRKERERKAATPRMQVVTEEDGKPVTFYHGTDKKFDKFEPQKSTRTILMSQYEVKTPAIFFTPDEAEAREYGDNIIPVNLQFEKLVEDNIDEAAQIITDYYVKEKDGVIEVQDGVVDLSDYYDEATDSYNNNWVKDVLDEAEGIDWMLLDEEALVEKFKEAGFDGTKVYEGDKAFSVATFYPENIVRLDQEMAPRQQVADIPQSAKNVLYGDSDVLPKPSKKKSNSQVAQELAEVAAEYYGGEIITSKTITPEQEETITEVGTEEAIAAFEDSGKSAADWYSTAIEKAMAVAAVIHPSLISKEEASKYEAFAKEKDPVAAANFAMRVALAITSQNLNVEANAKYANEQFDIFKKTGRFDASREYGTKAKSISSNLRLANVLVEKIGLNATEDFALQEFNVSELEVAASKALGKNVKVSGLRNDKVNGAALFGPKIGQGFLQNLMGKFDPVTIDLWLRRTWGRWTGDVVGVGVKEERMARLLNGLKEAKKDTGVEVPDVMKKYRVVRKVRPSTGASYDTMSDKFISELEEDAEFRDKIAAFAKTLSTKGDLMYKLIKNEPMSDGLYKAFISGEKTYGQTANQLQRIKDKLSAKYKDYVSKEKAKGRTPLKKSEWVKGQNQKDGRVNSPNNEAISARKPEWVKAATSITNDLKPIDIPTNQDRKVITRIVNDIKKRMTEQGYPVTNADVQALLWYPEKDIWAKLRGEEESNLKQSYDDQFIKIAEQKGLGKEAKSAAENVERKRASQPSGVDERKTDVGVSRPTDKEGVAPRQQVSDIDNKISNLKARQTKASEAEYKRDKAGKPAYSKAFFAEDDKFRKEIERLELLKLGLAPAYEQRVKISEELDELNKPFEREVGNKYYPRVGTVSKGAMTSEDSDLGGIYEAEVDGYLFRGVSVEDYNRIKKEGFIDTDLRGAISDKEGINLTPYSATAFSYLPEGVEGVVMAIKVSDKSGLFMIGADDYVRSSKPIPFTDVEFVTTPVIEGRYLSVKDGKSTPISIKKVAHPSDKKASDVAPRQQVIDDVTAKELDTPLDRQQRVFRSGDLENKAEPRWKFRSSRETGHFGTGFYFFGTKEQADKYDARDVSEIDIDKYNLAKATKELHQALRVINDRYNEYYTAEAVDELKKEPLRQAVPAFFIEEVAEAAGMDVISEAKAEAAATEVTKALTKDGNPAFGDSVSTLVMKSLGFDGVNAVGTSLDNSKYGTVIYDLKEDIAPRQQKPYPSSPQEATEMGYLVHASDKSRDSFDKKFIKGRNRTELGALGFYFTANALKAMDYGGEYTYIDPSDMNLLNLDEVKGNKLQGFLYDLERNIGKLSSYRMRLIAAQDKTRSISEFNELDAELKKVDAQIKAQSPFGTSASSQDRVLEALKKAKSRTLMDAYKVAESAIERDGRKSNADAAFSDLLFNAGYDGIYEGPGLYKVAIFDIDGLNNAIVKPDIASRQQLSDIATPLPRQQKSVREVVQQARDNNFKDAATKDFLQRKGVPTADIDKAIKTLDDVYARVMKEIDGVITKSQKRGVDFDTQLKNALAYLQGTKLYEDTTDIHREKLMREVRAKFDKKEKRAPSAKRILGNIKDVKKVTLSEKEALKMQLRLVAKTAKTTARALVVAGNELTKSLKEMVKGGVITANQMSSVLRRFSRVDLFNPASIDSFLDYMAKIFADAEYGAKIARIKKLLPRAKKNIKSKIGVADVLGDTLTKLFNVNPTLIPMEMLEDYQNLLEMMGAAKKVLPLADINDVTEMANKLLNAVYEEISMAEDLAEVFANYENKVIKDGKVDYAATIDAMIADQTISLEEAAVMRKYKSRIVEPTKKEPKTEEELAEERAELMSAVDAAKVNVSRLVMEEERTLARQLAKLMRTEAIERLSNQQLETLLAVIDNINNGFVTHAAQRLVEAMNASNRAGSFLDSIVKAVPLPVSTFVGKIKAGITKNNKFFESIKRNPLAYIDQVFGDFQTTRIYDAIFKPLAQAYDTFSLEMKRVDERLTDAQNAVLKSFKNDPNKARMSSYKMMAYMLQREFEANPDNKQVNPAADFIRATIEHINKGQSFFKGKDAEMLQQILDDFGGEQIDSQKLYDSFNKAERNALAVMEDINKSMGSKAVFTGAVIRGRRVDALNQYAHHNVLSTSGQMDKSADVSIIEAYNQSMRASTKAKNLIERTGAATPLNFDVFSSVSRGSRFTLTDFYLTEPIRTSRKTISDTRKLLEERGDVTKQENEIINAVENALELTLDDLLTRTFSQSTMLENVIQYVKKTGYRLVLASGTRAMAEWTSNVSFAAIYAPKDFAAGMANKKMVMGTVGIDVMSSLKSTQLSRMYPNEVLSGRMIDTSVLGEKAGDKGGRAKSDVLNKATQIYNGLLSPAKKGVEWVADTLIAAPDKAVIKPLWFGSFENAFVEITGKKPDFDKIAANDEAYMAANQEALDKATDTADQVTTLAGAADNPFKSMLRGKYPSKAKQTALLQFFNNFNSFMTRFLIYEYISARTAVNAMLGNGMISKRQGAALLGAVTTRMVVYTLAGTVLNQIMKQVFGLGDEEDEKDIEKQFGQALASTATSLIVGRDFGNVVKGLLNYGVENLNEEFLDELRDGDYDPYRDAIAYTFVPPDKEYKSNTLADYIRNLMGPFGPFYKMAEFGVKTLSADEKKDPAARIRQQRELNERLPLELLGNLGLIPLYRDIRALLLADIYKGMGKEKKGSSTGMTKAEKALMKEYFPEMYEMQMQLEEDMKNPELERMMKEQEKAIEEMMKSLK